MFLAIDCARSLSRGLSFEKSFFNFKSEFFETKTPFSRQLDSIVEKTNRASGINSRRHLLNLAIELRSARYYNV